MATYMWTLLVLAMIAAASIPILVGDLVYLSLTREVVEFELKAFGLTFKVAARGRR